MNTFYSFFKVYREKLHCFHFHISKQLKARKIFLFFSNSCLKFCLLDEKVDALSYGLDKPKSFRTRENIDFPRDSNQKMFA